MNRSPLRFLVSVIVGCAMLLACAAESAPSPGEKPSTITAEALQARLQSSAPKPLVIDVREPSEFEEGHIADAQLKPLGTIPGGIGDVPKEQEIVLVCRSGRRSAQAQKLLEERGYTNLLNMEGGMIAWAKAGLPVVK
jgi:rhodanese-related sulfurtransferase